MDNMISVDGETVALDDILLAREQRVMRRQKALKTYQQPTLTVSIVMPGDVKNCALSRTLADIALTEVQKCFEDLSWLMRVTWSANSQTGPEAIYSVETDVLALKRAMINLEDTHPLGRFWDLDVHGADGVGVSRQNLQEAPRRCLICNEVAYVCARSRAHTSDELLMFMRLKLQEWLAACP